MKVRKGKRELKMNCEKCGKVIINAPYAESTLDFIHGHVECEKCHAQTNHRCRCSSWLKEWWKFCPNCGTEKIKPRGNIN